MSAGPRVGGGAPGGLLGKLVAAIALLAVIVYLTPLRQSIFGVEGDATAPADPAGRAQGAAQGAVAVGAEAEALDKAGRHAESAARYARAAELADSAGDKELARKYRAQRGVCLKLSGRVEEAHEVLLAALAEAREAQDLRTEGLALGNLVRVAVLDGDLAVALSRLDELVDVARRQGDDRLAVQTLEQAAVAALDLGDPAGSLARLDAALALDPQLDPGERRHDALLGARANALVALGDDEGAAAVREGLPQTPALLANAARHELLLGEPFAAADLALSAADGFAAEGRGRLEERDRAVQLYLDALLSAGEVGAVVERLGTILAAAGDDEQAAAPFRVLSARVALAQGRPADAVPELRRARVALLSIREELARPDALVGGLRRADPSRSLRDVSLLLACALKSAGETEAASATLEDAPACLGREFLRAWIAGDEPPSDRLATEAAAGFDPDAWDPGDDSLAHLGELVPGRLPSWGHVALAAGVADAARLRDSGRGPLAESILSAAAARALRWQALQAQAQVTGLVPTPDDRRAQGEWAARWTSGGHAPDEALVALLPGETGALLLLCTGQYAATTFPLASIELLEQKAAELVRQLREGDTAAVARAGHELFLTVFPPGARQDLQGARRWTLILPDRLLAAPPTIWCAEDPAADGSARWLVEEHELALLPHAPGAVAPAGGRRTDWLELALPDVAPEGLRLVPARWKRDLGEGALAPVPAAELAQAVTITHHAASARSLREAVGQAGGLRLSVPGAGGGRLGGLLLAPAPDASDLFVDERAGFLPWHRLAQFPLPPCVVLDATRFNPEDSLGPGFVATALMAHARQVLLTRWPLPPQLREALAQEVVARLRAQGDAPDVGAALTSTLRSFLEQARAAGGQPHPRLWGGWLGFG